MTSPAYLPLLWLPLLATPFVEPHIYADAIARDLMVLSTALFAAAAFTTQTQTTIQQPRPDNRHYSWMILLLFLLPGAVLLATDSARAPWFVWRQSLYFSAIWLVFAMLNKHGMSWFAEKRYLCLVTLFAHLYVLYAVLLAFHPQWFSNQGPFLFWSDKVAHFPGPLRQQNQQALFLVLATIMIWRHLPFARCKHWWEVASLLPIAGIFLTASRSGLLVLLLAALLVATFDRNRVTWWILFRTITLGAVISILILGISPQHQSNILAHIETGLTDYTPSIRVLIWTTCLQLWSDHLWLGVGWGNLAANLYDAAATTLHAHPELAPATGELAGGLTQAHNLILQFLVEGGVIAASSLLLLFAALLQRARSWWKHPQTASTTAVNGWICAVAMLAHGMVSVALMEPFFMVLLAIALAACFTVEHEHAA